MAPIHANLYIGQTNPGAPQLHSRLPRSTGSAMVQNAFDQRRAGVLASLQADCGEVAPAKPGFDAWRLHGRQPPYVHAAWPTSHRRPVRGAAVAEARPQGRQSPKAVHPSLALHAAPKPNRRPLLQQREMVLMKHGARGLVGCR